MPGFLSTTDWVDSALVGLIALALKATVILAGAWAATFFLRRGSAATRHAIWSSAVAGVLALPVLTAIVPGWDVPVLTVAARVAPSAETAPRPAQTEAVAAASPSAPPATSTTVGASAPIQAARAPQPFLGGLSATTVIIGAWLVLAMLMLLRLAVATVRLTSWQRSSRPVEDAGWLALVRKLARNYGIERPVVLLENGQTDVPVTWGIVYPVILIPSNADQWDEEQRVAVLTHELAHVKRFDALSQLLGQIALAVLWFHPLAWMAVRRMRLEREHACDDFVLVAGARASRYADDLLGLARRLARPTAPAAAALAMARRSELEGRLLAILDPAMKRTAIRRARVALLTTAVLALATPLAAFRPAARVTEAPLPPTSSNAAAAKANRTSTPEVAPRAPLRPTAALLRQLADTEPAVVIDVAALIDITRATKRMTSDYEKGQMLARIAKRYQANDTLRDAYLDVVFSMSSDHERGNALLALMARDSLPLSSTARVLRSAMLMSSDYSRAMVLKRINPATFADSAVQAAYLDVIVAMSSNTERAAAISSLVKQKPLPPAVQLGILRAASLMSTNTEKANVLLLFLEHQGTAVETVRRAFMKAAETLSSDHDYRRVMNAVLR